MGNHDNPNQRFYERFNMEGRRYYSFADGKARFFALDSTYMTREQVAWLEAEVRDSDEPWKICFLHHPLYSSGRRHGPDEDLRSLVEPLFIKHGVSAVFAGHDHFYERLRPQHGITHFIAGAAGKVRRGNIVPGELTDKGFDRDLSSEVLRRAVAVAALGWLVVPAFGDSSRRFSGSRGRDHSHSPGARAVRFGVVATGEETLQKHSWL